MVPAKVGDQALLLGGDFITGGLGIKLSEENAYERILDKMAKLQKGDPLTVSILRAGVEEELSMPFPGR